jgi:transglutaminase-like putative cysteine protease
MRFEIRYQTSFTYDQPVFGSYNELRACPASGDGQRLLSYRVSVDPTTRVLSHIDYWGTRVDTFGVLEPHDHLDVSAEATVETSPARLITSSPTLTSALHPDFADEHTDLLERTAHTDWDDAIAHEAVAIRDAYGDDLVSMVLAIHRRTRSALCYDRDATGIGDPLPQVFAGGAGVCQDYAHLAVAMCRSIGIPARYVSGYLFSAADDSVEDFEGESVQVQTHAWFEAAIPDFGWLALDPTNGREVGVRHVVIGRGRDYNDVAPFYGAHNGRAEVTLTASVEIRRGEPATQSVPAVTAAVGGILRLSGPPPTRPRPAPLRQTHQPVRTAADATQQQQQQQ